MTNALAQTPNMANAVAQRTAERRLFFQGLNDGFDGLPPAWLGIDSYKRGYAFGLSTARHPEGATLVGQSPDGRERVYLYEGSEIVVRFDACDHHWKPSVPGYGGYPAYSVKEAFHGIPAHYRARAGRWVTENPSRLYPSRIVFVSEAA